MINLKEPDGWVIIGTKLDNKDFEKELRKTTSEIQRYSRENEKLLEKKAKIEIDLSEYEREKEAITESTNERLKLSQNEDQVNWVLGEEEIELEQLNQKYSEQFLQLDTINEKIEKNKTAQQLLTQEAEKFSEEIRKTKGLDNINKSINKIGNSLNHVIKRVGHWAVAVIGVYSAYSFVRQAMNTISQYDKQLATDLEYIRYAIAMTLKPVVEFIVKLIYKLLYYTGYLLKAWFGIDIFANSSADSFRKAKESLKSSAKSAKEIRKQLAGFDEMEILQDLNSNNNTGNDSGFVMPSYDLSKMQGDVPGWLKWLGDNRDWILALLGGIAGALIAIRLGASLIQALGIGITIAGIITAIQGLLAYLDDPSWENFGKVIEGIGIAVIGIGIAFLSLPTIIAGAIILVLGIIIKYWDKIKKFLQGGIDWLVGKSDWIHEHFGDFIGGIYDLVVGWLQDILDFTDRTFGRLKDIFDNIIDFVKNVFAGNWKEAWENIKNIFGDIIETLVDLFKLAIQPIIDIVDSITSWIFNPTKKIKGGTSSGAVNSAFRAKGGVFYPSKLPKLAMGGIINQPGKGVPYNGAIIGERGAEAVLPLTDSGQMALLGEAIGKYVNINATIPVYVGNRQVARTIRKIDAEDDFAFNK